MQLRRPKENDSSTRKTKQGDFVKIDPGKKGKATAEESHKGARLQSKEKKEKKEKKKRDLSGKFHTNTIQLLVIHLFL